jgi:hypothetical protein
MSTPTTKRRSFVPGTFGYFTLILVLDFCLLSFGFVLGWNLHP